MIGFSIPFYQKSAVRNNKAEQVSGDTLLQIIKLNLRPDDSLHFPPAVRYFAAECFQPVNGGTFIFSAAGKNIHDCM